VARRQVHRDRLSAVPESRSPGTSKLSIFLGEEEDYIRLYGHKPGKSAVDAVGVAKGSLDSMG
jgi:hypothetical protein